MATGGTMTRTHTRADARSIAVVELPERIDAAIVKRRGLGLDHCGDDLPDMRKLEALLGEVREVAQACNAETRQRVRYELLDVAVCVVLWASCEPCDADAR